MNLTEVQQGKFGVQSFYSSCFEKASAVDVVLYLSAAAVVLLTVCGNLLVIISICHFKQLHTPTNLLLLSLAVADLLVGVTVMPFYFITLIESQWCFSAVYCTIYNVASLYLTCVSIYNVSCIAADRYFALYNPFLYSTKITVNITLKIMSTMWLYLLFYNVILFQLNGNITNVTANNTYAGECPISFKEIWTIIDFALVFFLPCSTIIILYMFIFIIAKKHAYSIKNVRKNLQNTKQKNCSTASDRKAAKIIGMLVFVFLLCLVPSYICLFLYVKKIIQEYVSHSMVILLYSNSAINPIIYALFYPWFQSCVKLIITLRICSPGSSLKNVSFKHT